jgi:predicted nucleic acid-binding Zn ribbon protein
VPPAAFAVDGGRLVLRADSTAWASVMGLQVEQVRRRIGQEVGAGVVRHVTVLGPVAPSWKHGPRSVPGRGPRDTYG